MTSRVSPTERIRSQIDELIANATKGNLLEHFEQVARLSVRLVMQSALEAEVTEFLGRDRYSRKERDLPSPSAATRGTRLKPTPETADGGLALMTSPRTWSGHEEPCGKLHRTSC